ncbi:MAG: SIMPL domain-containing protein [Gemmatimonadaceae bacterium]|nr:SIMPL domain-containing protein [Gemmatimonadaceae bacterium]
MAELLRRRSVIEGSAGWQCCAIQQAMHVNHRAITLRSLMIRSLSNQFCAVGARLSRIGAVMTAGAVLLVTSARYAGAQTAPPTPTPQISVSARGEIQIAPDRARVQVGVETQAKTAAAASAENNRKQTAILAAIKALGIPAAQITTLNFSVSPVQRYDDKDRRVVIDGYQVSNIVQVVSDKLEQAGPIIDAALANGANRVAGLDFMVKDPSSARDAALAQAVQSARRQAEVAAKAAGGTLSELLEINVNEYERPEPRPMMSMAKMDAGGATPTPISEGTATVSVAVSTRWRFKP